MSGISITSTKAHYTGRPSHSCPLSNGFGRTFTLIFLAPFSAKFLFFSRLIKHNNKNTPPDGRRIPCLTTCFHGCLKGLKKHILSLKHNIQKFCPDNKHVHKKSQRAYLKETFVNKAFTSVKQRQWHAGNSS